MKDGTTTTRQRADPGRVVLVDRWADFAKAMSIYPEANVRVRQALDALVAAVDGVRALAAEQGKDRVPVVFEGEQVRCGEETAPLRDGSNLHWLKERLERGGLVGVEYHLDVKAPALVDFNRRLLGNFSRRSTDTTVDELWPEAYPGIRLLRQRLAATNGNGAEPGAGPGDEVQPRDADAVLAEALAADPSLADLAARATERLSSLSDDGAGLSARDLLKTVLDGMPRDLLLQDGGAKRLLAGMLARLAGDEVAAGDALPAPGGQAGAELEGLMLATARSLFGRTGPSRQIGDQDVGTRAAGHDGDDAIADDVDAFFSEHADLPSLGPGEAMGETAVVKAELAGVLLFYLTRVDSARQLQSIGRMLGPLLEDADDDMIRVLRPYVRGSLFRADQPRGAGAAGPRVLDFLRRSGREELIHRCVQLTPETVVDLFPTAFVPYLDGLDLGDPEDRAALARVLESVGPRRILEASDTLGAADALGAPARIERLAAHPSRALMPLMAAVLHAQGEAVQDTVRVFVRRLGLSDPVAQPLELLDAHDSVPASYLLELLDPRPDGSYPPPVQEAASAVLCDFVRRHAGRPGQVGRRAAAVRLLGRLRTATGRALLQDLLRSRTFLLVPREPATIRSAAREALQACRALKGA